ncbi:hypothetical protein OHA25_23485 [Nonomuraea sp. NBC_00507]|uniref:hypothetical protein n=1 Tax=Nonomuraea sp. NBC_00507 TaxID=2976002 RepID=UPI002E197DA4
MSPHFRDLGEALEWRAKGETLRVEAWGPDALFLLGPDLLIAPVTEAGARERAVHLPAGARWTDAWTGEEHDGGRTVSVAAPLERIPLFLRDGARLPIRNRKDQA